MKTLRTMLLTLTIMTLAACTAELQHDLSETEANELIVLLESQGIGADKTRDGKGDGWMVTVRDADRSASWRAMKAAGLPRRPAQGFDGLYPSGGLIPAPDEARVRLQAATAGELERSLQSMEGVLDARVHLVLPKTHRGLNTAQNQPPRASVLLKVDGADDGKKDQTAALVSGAVQGLAAQDVIVILDRATPTEIKPPTMASLGPFRVAPASIDALRGVFIAFMAVFAFLSAMVIVLLVRVRRMRLDAQPTP